MLDGRRSIAPVPDAEKIMVGQLRMHSAAPGEHRKPTTRCASCGVLPQGLDLLTHQARAIRNRLVQAGLMSEGEPKP